MNLRFRFLFSGNDRKLEGMRSSVLTYTNLPRQPRSLPSLMLEKRVFFARRASLINPPRRIRGLQIRSKWSMVDRGSFVLLTK